MIGLITGWAFGCFVGYRILSQLFFGTPMSMISCAILAVLTAGIIFFATAFYSVVGIRTTARIRLGDSNAGWAISLIGRFVGASAVNVLAGYGIVFGFSEKFYRQISRTSFRNEFYEQPWFGFVVILLVPMLLHLAMIAFSIRYQVILAKNSAGNGY